MKPPPLTVTTAAVSETSCAFHLCTGTLHHSGNVAVTGQKQGEFLAPVARDDIPHPPGRPGDDRRDLTQHTVAGTMAVAVVIEFEVIDIEHTHRQRCARPPTLRNGAEKGPVENPPHGHAGHPCGRTTRTIAV